MNSGGLSRWLTLGANVGVVIGLVLLLFEIRQNSDLMRAQIAMDRTNISMQTFSDWANGGEIARIEAKLFEENDGFPWVVGWREQLTTEERRRYFYRMRVRFFELRNDWYQCMQGLVDQDICQRQISDRIGSNIHRFYELGISAAREQDSFIRELQKHALDLGLPPMSDDGTWSDRQT